MANEKLTTEDKCYLLKDKLEGMSEEELIFLQSALLEKIKNIKQDVDEKLNDMN